MCSLSYMEPLQEREQVLHRPALQLPLLLQRRCDVCCQPSPRRIQLLLPNVIGGALAHLCPERLDRRLRWTDILPGGVVSMIDYRFYINKAYHTHTHTRRSE
jgi:hypothetical protein